MADPLSLAAGTIGILTAAAQISTLLINFTRTSKDAPQTARAVLTEVTDISGTLSHLQSFLLGNEFSDKSRMQLLQVDQVVTVMGGCVLTFSELEKLLDNLKVEDMGILDRARWARKEKAIVSLIQRLQNHKASLSLILHILNGNTMMEAKTSMDRLHGMIEHCYEEMSSRIVALELRTTQFSNGSLAEHQPASDSSSILTIKAPPPDLFSPELRHTTSSDIVVFGFTEALQQSWVYRRNRALHVSGCSLYSRDTCSMAWSCLSDLSWADVSNISVFDLPISVDEVHNPLRSTQTWMNEATDSVWSVLSTEEVAANTQAVSALPRRKTALERRKIIETFSLGRSWPNDCCRCQTCGTLLQPSANPLRFGDNSNICSNCTYNCSSCGMEIEGLAILTGDQAFCAACFECRNCKKKIENLKYGRTSQGLVCMVCHEDLMAAGRRRKALPPLPEMSREATK